MDGPPRCLKRDLNPMTINMGATKKNYARVLRSQSFKEFGVWIEAPDFHFGMPSGDHNHSASGPMLDFGLDFHSVGHGSVGGEVNKVTLYFC
jgi:hypothetical protein